MTTATELTRKHCVSCEEGAKALTADQVRGLLPSVPTWKLAADGKKIRREWKVLDFPDGARFLPARRQNRRGGGSSS